MKSATDRILKIFRFIWLAAAILCLAFSIYVLISNDNASDAQRGADSFLILVMLFLTFPAGWAIIYLLYIVSFFASGTGQDVFGLVTIWVAFAVVGYLQWFVFLPWGRKKISAYIKQQQQST
jgi:hypothetical protein